MENIHLLGGSGENRHTVHTNLVALIFKKPCQTITHLKYYRNAIIILPGRLCTTGTQQAFNNCLFYTWKVQNSDLVKKYTIRYGTWGYLKICLAFLKSLYKLSFRKVYYQLILIYKLTTQLENSSLLSNFKYGH